MEFGGLELFLDDERISFRGNVRREVVRPQMHAGNPVLRREYPWEQGHVCLHGTVLDEDGVFRMWYQSVGKNYPSENFTGYAESEDGIHWRKPLMALYPYEGIERTNIVFGAGFTVTGPSVIRNPDPTDLQRRYLMLFDSYCKEHDDSAHLGFRWSYTAHSPDGIHWSPRQGQPAFPGKADSCQCVLWDHRRQVFRAYARRTISDPYGTRSRIWNTVESPDFVRWGDAQELLRLDEQDGGSDAQIQQLAVTDYDGIYVGLLSMFRVEHVYEGPLGGYARWNGAGPQGGYDEGPQINDIQLVTSRDGVRFSRVADRALFMPHAEREGAFSTTGHRVASHLVVRGDTVYIFCDGRTGAWGDRSPMEIGLATLPRDRFVCLRPDHKRAEGVVELAPMRYPSGALRLNATTLGTTYTSVAPIGSIQAEVADMGGAVIPGFERDRAVPLLGDALDHPVQWQQGGDPYDLRALPASVSEPVRLRFWLRNAKLYALRAETENETPG